MSSPQIIVIAAVNFISAYFIRIFTWVHFRLLLDKPDFSCTECGEME